MYLILHFEAPKNSEFRNTPENFFPCSSNLKDALQSDKWAYL